jgi:hypothetical protein
MGAIRAASVEEDVAARAHGREAELRVIGQQGASCPSKHLACWHKGVDSLQAVRVRAASPLL